MKNYKTLHTFKNKEILYATVFNDLQDYYLDQLSNSELYHIDLSIQRS